MQLLHNLGQSPNLATSRTHGVTVGKKATFTPNQPLRGKLATFCGRMELCVKLRHVIGICNVKQAAAT